MRWFALVGALLLVGVAASTEDGDDGGETLEEQVTAIFGRRPGTTPSQTQSTQLAPVVHEPGGSVGQLFKSDGARKEAVRAGLSEQNLDGVIVVTGSRHSSEFVSDRDRLRSWVTGFDGSAGDAVITKSEAIVWTDGRYTTQARQQLRNGWKLGRHGHVGIHQWLAKQKAGTRLGVDPSRISILRYQSLQKHAHASGVQLVPLDENLVGKAWVKRPSEKFNEIVSYPLRLAGQSPEAKVARAVAAMPEGVEWLFSSSLDEIAWLLNLRGSDVEFVPYFYSFLLLRRDGDVTLFVNGKLTAEAEASLKGLRLTVRPYGDVKTALGALKCSKRRQVLIDPSRCHQSNLLSLPRDAHCALLRDSPVRALKMRKTEREMAGMRSAHLRDSAALVEFYAWLEAEMSKGTKLNEVDLAKKLEVFRGQQAMYKGPSFPAVVSVGANAAVIHYEPHADRNPRTLSAREVLLIDSGGQYLDGTTDVTRVTHYGTPSPAEREGYTLVLKSHLAVAMARFAPGTTGSVLDKMARKPLKGRDYAHATGHGIGAYLDVHEGPVGISSMNRVPLRTRMVVSDEPGLYVVGKYGVRLESAIAAQHASSSSRQDGASARFESAIGNNSKLNNNNSNKNGGASRWLLDWEYLTLVPMEPKLIRADLLSAEERAWVDGFHVRCLRLVGPLVSSGAQAWLKERAQPLA